MEDRGALYLCAVWRIEEHFNCVLSKVGVVEGMLQLTTTADQYDEVSKRKVVQLL